MATATTRLIDLSNLEVEDAKRVVAIDRRIATALRLDTYGQPENDIEFLLNLLARERQRTFEQGVGHFLRQTNSKRELAQPYVEEAARATALIETERAVGRG